MGGGDRLQTSEELLTRTPYNVRDTTPVAAMPPPLCPGPLAVCGGAEVIVGGVQAGDVEGGIAIWFCGLVPFLRLVWVRQVVLLRRRLSRGCDSVVGVGIGFVCQGLGSLNRVDQDVLVSCVLASPPEDKVPDGLVEAIPWVDEVPECPHGQSGPVLL